MLQGAYIKNGEKKNEANSPWWQCGKEVIAPYPNTNFFLKYYIGESSQASPQA